MKEANESEVLHRMAAYCSRAERCIRDVQEKAVQAGLSVESAGRLIAYLVKEKYIDENRFAHSFVIDKFRINKWGRIKIGHGLAAKNIPPAIRQEALAAIDGQEYKSVLVSLLKDKKKFTKAANEHELFCKLLRFAAGRGFENGMAVSCLREIIGNDEDTGDFE